jgi:WD repeat-containing protein 42A
MKDTNGAFMKLFSIDINPMNPFEFIINGDDEYVRMFDKRKLSNGPIKMFEASYPHDRVG